MTYQIQGNVVIDDSRNGYFENLPVIQTPVNLSPANGETDVAKAGLTLCASSFSHIFTGSTASLNHYASSWQLANASSFATNNIVENASNVVPGSNTFVVTASLGNNTTYYWRVRYSNFSNTISNYSNTTSFTTADVPTSIGQSFGGGYYTGTVHIGGGVCYYLIVAPNATGCAKCAWSTAAPGTLGASSFCNGYTNTRPLMESASYPAGNWTATRSIGGFSDWYMPSYAEVNTMFANRASMPAGEQYVTSPGTPSIYWTSTEYNVSCARLKFFAPPGIESFTSKIACYNTRAVRRVPI